MVFPQSDYDTNNSFGFSNGQYTYTHKAFGAELLRYSWNFGQNWTDWKPWEDTTVIDASVFACEECFWQGKHIMVQCKMIITSKLILKLMILQIGAQQRRP